MVRRLRISLGHSSSLTLTVMNQYYYIQYSSISLCSMYYVLCTLYTGAVLPDSGSNHVVLAPKSTRQENTTLYPFLASLPCFSVRYLPTWVRILENYLNFRPRSPINMPLAISTAIRSRRTNAVARLGDLDGHEFFTGTNFNKVTCQMGLMGPLIQCPNH